MISRGSVMQFKGEHKPPTVEIARTLNVDAVVEGNSSLQPVRMFCICSPAGPEDFFREIGVLVATRTAAPPELDEAAQLAFRKKAAALAPKYRTELLPHT